MNITATRRNFSGSYNTADMHAHFTASGYPSEMYETPISSRPRNTCGQTPTYGSYMHNWIDDFATDNTIIIVMTVMPNKIEK